MAFSPFPAAGKGRGHTTLEGHGLRFACGTLVCNVSKTEPALNAGPAESGTTRAVVQRILLVSGRRARGGRAACNAKRLPPAWLGLVTVLDTCVSAVICVGIHPMRKQGAGH